jgi:hypothetical protein
MMKAAFLGALLACTTLATAVVLYRRPGNGGRLQLASVPEPNLEDSMEGWLSTEQGLAIETAESSLVECAQPQEQQRGSKRGRKSLDWEPHCTDPMQEQETLRNAATRWLTEKGVLHKPLASSTDKGQKTLIGHCDKCTDCSTAYRFKVITADPKTMGVEKTGNCGDIPNLKKIRLANAKRYAEKQHSRQGAFQHDQGQGAI